MKSMSSNSGNFMALLAVAVVIVLLFAILTSMYATPPPPKVEVKDCSLASGTVQNGGQTTLSIAMQSNDAQDAHTMTVELTSYQLVTFFMGAQELQQNGTIWYYQLSIDPKASYTSVVNVRPTLESGVAQITYSINVVVFMEGTQVFSKNLDLVVKPS